MVATHRQSDATGPNDDESNDLDRRDADEDSVSSDQDAGDDSTDALLFALRHEPLKPPPEIEAELERAKLQLQRPAVLASDLRVQGDRVVSARDSSSGDETRASAVAAQQQYFVAADRARMAIKSPTSASTTGATHVRARYVDTFNHPV